MYIHSFILSFIHSFICFIFIYFYVFNVFMYVCIYLFTYLHYYANTYAYIHVCIHVYACSSSNSLGGYTTCTVRLPTINWMDCGHTLWFWAFLGFDGFYHRSPSTSAGGQHTTKFSNFGDQPHLESLFQWLPLKQTGNILPVGPGHRPAILGMLMPLLPSRPLGKCFSSKVVPPQKKSSIGSMKNPTCPYMAWKITRTPIYIYIDLFTYIHTYTHTYIHPCIHTYMQKYTNTYIRTYVQTYIHA